eukprot:TRINITY_DN10816_c0_g1_i1.p1 TRINITY_DN10816_c0_g1~~TRINITY_DN10816_c0_g1_i1.p1  ORF type:complete len:518 (+),score=66.75 TRINITY_DN10816_c0_g1_i1:133-1554(+)
MALGLFRFGFLAQLFSCRALLSGFVNAVAIEVIFEQTDKFFGFNFANIHSFHKFEPIIHDIDNANYYTFAIGISCATFLILTRVIKRKLKIKWLMLFPETLLVVITSILFARYLHLDKKGVPILGATHAGFMPPRLPDFKMIDPISLMTTSIVISMIGIMESILCAGQFADKYHYSVSHNRELVAYGAANMIGGAFTCFPAFGSLPRTAMNDAVGARSQASSFFSAITVMFAILFLLPFVFYLPKVTMAAIIVSAATSLFEVEDVLFLWKVRAWGELILFVVIFGVTLGLGIELGVVTTIIVSLLLVVRTASHPHVAILKQSPESNKFEEVASLRDVNLFHDKHSYYSPEGIFAVRLEDSLDFANARSLKEFFSKIEQRAQTPPHLSAIIIDCKNVLYIDSSASRILLEMVEEWKRKDIMLCLAKLRHEPKEILFKSGVVQTLGADRIFAKLNEALHYCLAKGKTKMEYSSYQ